ncbi:hypothetical protein [Mycoplasmopsis columboralis]|uniref:Uncharacterized protein n=1 Tax=Mycoplasmopsis columboralis TaxID=171282 RepID=A0A449B770_9BACT|nr:hypothetical protein [Mycoplasmopsis columboralis]VEU76436.1 Uncharacterised protein [Mycoplasmopsis columboralis]
MNEKLKKYESAYDFHKKKKVENPVLQKYTRWELIKKLKYVNPYFVEEAEQEQETVQEKKKLSRVWWIILIIIVIILLILLAILIAYLADFFIYKDTDLDGLLLTKAQRYHGVLWRHF